MIALLLLCPVYSPCFGELRNGLIINQCRELLSSYCVIVCHCPGQLAYSYNFWETSQHKCLRMFSLQKVNLIVVRIKSK